MRKQRQLLILLILLPVCIILLCLLSVLLIIFSSREFYVGLPSPSLQEIDKLLADNTIPHQYLRVSASQNLFDNKTILSVFFRTQYGFLETNNDSSLMNNELDDLAKLFCKSYNNFNKIQIELESQTETNDRYGLRNGTPSWYYSCSKSGPAKYEMFNGKECTGELYKPYFQCP